MNESHDRSFRQIFHVVADDHGARATLAMRIVRCGAHAEIYESLDEVLDARPATGAILVEFPKGGVAGLSTSLHAAGVFLPVIVFSESPKPSDVIRAAHAGVADFLSANFTDEDILAAYVYAQRFMERNASTLQRKHRAQDQIALLSARERQILAFMVEGHSNKSIGKVLDLSPRTVEDYRLNALRKLGVTSSSAAIRIGLEADLKAAMPSAMHAA